MKWFYIIYIGPAMASIGIGYIIFLNFIILVNHAQISIHACHMNFGINDCNTVK